MTVLVGPSEEAFRVPQDLLMQYSQALGKMCQSEFMETHTRTIRLPEVEVPVFENFLVWLYAYKPHLDGSTSADTLVDLAIFGEIYLIHHLKNQTSDALRAGLAKEEWKPTPGMISKVYQNVPSASILRRLYSLGFAMVSDADGWGGHSVTAKKYEKLSEWEPIFRDFVDFGWDYFKIIQKSSSSSKSSISLGGVCRFHDHSDIFGWEREVQAECPYLHGPQPLIWSQNVDAPPSAVEEIPSDIPLETASLPGDELPLQGDNTHEEESL